MGLRVYEFGVLVFRFEVGGSFNAKESRDTGTHHGVLEMIAENLILGTSSDESAMSLL